MVAFFINRRNILRNTGSMFLAGLLALVGACEDNEVNLDDHSVGIAREPMTTSHWIDFHAAVKPNSLYEITIEGSNNRQVDLVKLSGWGNVTAEDGSHFSATYSSQPADNWDEVQTSPTFRVRTGYTGKIGDPNYVYPSTDIGFILNVPQADSEGYLPRRMHLVRVQE